MTFSSLPFLVFFIITYLLILVWNSKVLQTKVSNEHQLLAKHGTLLLASYVFYGWWDYRFCFLMGGLTVIAWFCAKRIDQNRHKKLFLAIGVIVPLVTLGFFKYFNFFIDSFAQLFSIKTPGALSIILPVGISFYTFQSMSYTIDVMRGEIKSYSLLDVALYVSFFPQLVAGPIVKASDFMPQLKENKPLKRSDLCEGVQIFLFGLIKKLVIADNLSVFVDDVFEKPLAYSSLTVILAVISYSIQIYCDFSGYSDMAIGTARCFGYHFIPNFNMPYLSRNVTEFWKRWHISLSTWLQEYLYIPLGGNRKGKVRRYINLMTTMVLGGLWHGANYTFVLWGLLHGAALCVHKLFLGIRKNKTGTAIGSVLSGMLTYVFVCICWVFFRAESLSAALDVLTRMFVWQDGITQIYSWTLFCIVLVSAASLVAVVKSKRAGNTQIQGDYLLLNLNKFGHLVIFFTVIFLFICLAYTNANPFIYFQF